MSERKGFEVRFNRPERRQMEWRDYSLDQYIQADHLVRIVWRYVELIDLSSLKQSYEEIEGRNPVDPQIMLALWIYATTESISSAQEIDRCCKSKLEYMWICGGVSVNHELIANFRTQNQAFLEKTLITTISSLLYAGAITLGAVAHDVRRPRAPAGNSSFRRRAEMERCLAKAKEHVARLKKQEANPEIAAANKAAQQRALDEKLARANEALQKVLELEKREKEAKEDRTI